MRRTTVGATERAGSVSLKEKKWSRGSHRSVEGLCRDSIRSRFGFLEEGNSLYTLSDVSSLH